MQFDRHRPIWLIEEPSKRPANFGRNAKKTRRNKHFSLPNLFRSFALGIVSLSFALPTTASAGLFSSLIGPSVEAQTYPAKLPSNVPYSAFLSQSTIGPLALTKEKISDVPDLVMSDKELIPVMGPLGSPLDVAELPQSVGRVSVYTVHDGDSLSKVAELFGVTTGTIIAANDLTPGAPLKTGTVLTILPVSGLYYTVKNGDTLAGIAKKYKVDVRELSVHNDFSVDSALIIGETLLIPDEDFEVVAVKPVPKSASKSVQSSVSVSRSQSTSDLGGIWTRPVPAGARITQGVHGHNGVDIAAPRGTTIVAAYTGTVIVARSGGYNGGYGSYVVIEHPNQTQTLYAHLSSVSVSVGQTVSAGSVIGVIGSTGRSTGIHLHFEVIGAKNFMSNIRYGL